MEYIKLVNGYLDLAVIGAIAFITFTIANTIGDTYPRVREWAKIVLSLGMGTLWGYQLAQEQQYGFGSWVIKGVMINGGGALLGVNLAERIAPQLMNWLANKVPTLFGIDITEHKDIPPKAPPTPDV